MAVGRRRDLKFHRKLYIGDTVKKPKRLIRKLKGHKLLPLFYVLAYEGETGRLAIYPSPVLSQWHYKEHPPDCIVGLAGDQAEAFELIRRIAEEAYAATGGALLTAYLASLDPAAFSTGNC